MSTIVEIRVPAADFELGRALEGVEADGFELGQIVPTDEERMPFLWVHDAADYGAVADALRADEETGDADFVGEVDAHALFRIRWEEGVDGLVEAIVAHDATILGAVGTPEHWDFQLRFAGEADVPGFRAACEDAGVDLDLRRIYSAADPALDDDATGLTPVQRETLLTALEVGYFAVPRETTLVELAAELGISDQAVSERLRRAQAKLLTTTLVGGTLVGGTDGPAEPGHDVRPGDAACPNGG
jgi:predicted DNA binding protein